MTKSAAPSVTSPKNVELTTHTQETQSIRPVSTVSKEKEAVEENIESSVLPEQSAVKVQTTSIYDASPDDAPAKPTPNKPAVNAALLRRKSTSTVNQHAVASYITAAGKPKSSDNDRFVKKKLHHKAADDNNGGLEEQGLYEVYTVPTANGKSESSGTVLARKGSVSWRNRIPNPSSKSFLPVFKCLVQLFYFSNE